MGDQKIYWPQWVAEDAPYANVWELNYETLKAKFSENHLLISELARILPLTFSAKGLGQRPIVWVAHSQGGLVLKHLVRQHLLDKSNESLANLVNMTIGVEFFATPHKGSSAATASVSMLKTLRDVVNHYVFLGIPSIFTRIKNQAGIASKRGTQLGALERNSPELIELDTIFQGWHATRSAGGQSLEIISFYETIETNGVLIVDRSSAEIPAHMGLNIPRSANHIEICKLNSREDPAYLWLINLLNKREPKNNKWSILGAGGVTKDTRAEMATRAWRHALAECAGREDLRGIVIDIVYKITGKRSLSQEGLQENIIEFFSTHDSPTRIAKLVNLFPEVKERVVNLADARLVVQLWISLISSACIQYLRDSLQEGNHADVLLLPDVEWKTGVALATAAIVETGCWLEFDQAGALAAQNVLDMESIGPIEAREPNRSSALRDAIVQELWEWYRRVRGSPIRFSAQQPLDSAILSALIAELATTKHAWPIMIDQQATIVSSELAQNLRGNFGVRVVAKGTTESLDEDEWKMAFATVHQILVTLVRYGREYMVANEQRN